MTDKHDTYVGLDMSGARTRCLIVAGDGPNLRYLGCGSMPPVQWDDEAGCEAQLTPESVLEAVCEAELEAGLTVVSAVVGIGGAQVRSGLVHSAIQLPMGRNVIRNADLADVVRQAARAITNDSTTVLQLVPLEFAADEVVGLRNPVGLCARRLEARVRVISISQAAHDVVTSLVNQASFRVDETLLSACASAYSALTVSECTNGVALLDMGKTCSGLVVTRSGVLTFAQGIPVGRDHLVSNLSRAFGTDPAVATSLISDFGTAAHRDDLSGTYVYVPQPGPAPGGRYGRLWPRNMLDKIIALGVEECMALVRDSLDHERLGGGEVRSLVLTGDMAAIPGVREMAQQVVGLRCRVGVPTRPEGLPATLRSPGWACAAGLVLYAYRLASSPTGGQLDKHARLSSQEMARVR